MTVAKLDAAAIHERAKKIIGAPASAQPAMTAKVRRDVSDLAAQLDTQLTWLFEHPNHPRFPELEDRWLGDLKHYEAARDVLNNVATQKGLAA